MAERRKEQPFTLQEKVFLIYSMAERAFAGSPTAQGIYIASACSKEDISHDEFAMYLFEPGYAITRFGQEKNEAARKAVCEAESLHGLPQEVTTRILENYTVFIGAYGQLPHSENLASREKVYNGYAHEIARQYHENPVSKEAGE